MSKETPCIAICIIDPKTKLCLGCGRTLPEIGAWHSMDSAGRLDVMTQLAPRMAAAGLPPASTYAPKQKATTS